MDSSLPGSSDYGILQARVLEWVAISFSRGSSWPRDQTQVSGIAGRHFPIWATREYFTCMKYTYTYTYTCICVCVYTVWVSTPYIYIYIYAHVCVLNCFSHAPLCDPMDCGPPGSPVHGILLQEYTGVEGHVLLQAIFSGIEPASPSAPALQADSLPLSHRRSPIRTHTHPHPRTLTI